MRRLLSCRAAHTSGLAEAQDKLRGPRCWISLGGQVSRVRSGPTGGSMGAPGRMSRGTPSPPVDLQTVLFCGALGRCTATLSATTAATLRADAEQGPREKNSAKGRHSRRCPAHGAWTARRTPNPGVDPTHLPVSVTSVGIAGAPPSPCRAKPGGAALDDFSSRFRPVFGLFSNPRRTAINWPAAPARRASSWHQGSLLVGSPAAH